MRANTEHIHTLSYMSYAFCAELREKSPAESPAAMLRNCVRAYVSAFSERERNETRHVGHNKHDHVLLEPSGFRCHTFLALVERKSLNCRSVCRDLTSNLHAHPDTDAFCDNWDWILLCGVFAVRILLMNNCWPRSLRLLWAEKCAPVNCHLC